MMYSLGDRMKGYESITNASLIKRMPVIIRIDGMHFHTFTRGFKKPFDSVFQKAMKETTKILCLKIQGCVFAYTQSDEISLLLCDFQTYDTQPWFGNRVEKICSAAASLATLYFNLYFKSIVSEEVGDNDENLIAYLKAISTGAIFDARCFNLTKDEVNNYFVWRQKNCMSNSVQSMAQSLFSQKEIQGISTDGLVSKMAEEMDVDYFSIADEYQRGVAVKKTENGWITDTAIPIFSINKSYVEEAFTFS